MRIMQCALNCTFYSFMSHMSFIRAVSLKKITSKGFTYRYSNIIFYWIFIFDPFPLPKKC